MLPLMEIEEEDQLDCTGLSGCMPIILLAANHNILDDGRTIQMIATDPETCITVPMWCEYVDKKYLGPMVRQREGSIFFIHGIRNLTEEEKVIRRGGEKYA